MSAPRLSLMALPLRQHWLWVGTGAADALAAAGHAVPELLRFTTRGEVVIARLARNQFLLMGAGDLAPPPGVLCLSHPFAEFALSGPDAPALLQEVASANAADCDADSWFCTRICTLDAVLRRAGTDWHVLCAPADAPWLGEALAAQVLARGGEASGFNHSSTRG